MYQKHKISDRELKKYQESEAPLDNNLRAHLIYKEQSQNFTLLRENLEKLKKQLVEKLTIDGVKLRLVLNITRKSSLKATTFKRKDKESKCKLCQLPAEQKGFPVLNNKYFVLPNPGITIPGDLTIAATKHRNQEISGNFNHLLTLARQLYDYSIYFNGALAGATSPHMHFQAGLQNKLPGEKQILSALNNNRNIKLSELNRLKNVKIYRVNNFLRECYIIHGKNELVIRNIFQRIMAILKKINLRFKSSINVPRFGAYIPAIEKKEEEARINLMVNYDKNWNAYSVAIFPKRTNRPRMYYSDTNKIILGMAIKEALGNLITFRKKDFNSLKNSPEKIIKAYADTSITRTQSQQFSDKIKRLKI